MRISKLFTDLRVPQPAIAITLSGALLLGFVLGATPATAEGTSAVAQQLSAVAQVAAAGGPTTTSGQKLAFDLPDQGAHRKLVFAHYFSPYPVSIDNKAPDVDYYARNYLQPSGENGKHADVGGILRDRPMGRDPLGGDWKLEDAKNEIKQAKSAGIDGWTLDILNLNGTHWEAVSRMVDAADAVGGFRIILQPDMTSSVGAAESGAIADRIASLAGRPSLYRLGSADFVLSAFKAEAKSADWWRGLMGDITAKSGFQVTFIPTVLNADTMTSFAPISYGIGNWGVRNPGNIIAGPDYAARAHALGLKWMAPVAIQDERPNQKMYDEAGNTETLRYSWHRAVVDQADLVQLITWNDYSEGTSFAPSAGHGYSFLDLNAFWQSQFQTGQTPAIVRDAFYVTHRIQKYAATPTFPQQLMVLPGYKAGLAARDTVEVVTLLTAPAQITLQIGPHTYSYGAPAGADARLYPLDIGHITVTAARGGSSIGVADSLYTVSATPYTQDLAYYAVSGRMAPRALVNGDFICDTGNGRVYRLAGGAPIYVSTWNAFGGARPCQPLPTAKVDALPRYPADGTFIRDPASGAVYRVAGGAPVYVSTWSAFGGEQSVIDIDPAAVDRAGIGGEYDHLRTYPADGTFIRGTTNGAIYRIAGRAPQYVSTWSAFGGPQPTVDVDSAAIDQAGNGSFWNHLQRFPVDGTFLRGTGNGAVYRVAGGAPVYVSTWAAFGGEQPVVNIDSAAIDQAGGGFYSHLRYYPAEGTFVRGTSTGAVFRIAGGAPIYVTTWAAFGGEQPLTNVDYAALANAGGAGNYRHLRLAPLDGSFLQGQPGGRIYRIAGGFASYVATWVPWGGPQPYVSISQETIDRAGSGGDYNHLVAVR